MTTPEIILTTIGFALPVLLAPVAVLILRRLFALFLTEGTELFGDFSLDPEEAASVGALMAKFNVLVLLLAWLGVFTCMCFHQPHFLLLGIALTGVTSAIVISMMIVKSNLQMDSGALMMVGILAFAGGNLPIIVLVAILMVLVRLVA